MTTDAANLQHASADASIFRIRPAAVVFPRSVTGIQRLVRYVGQSNVKGQMSKVQKPQLSLTVRSGGTDMTGGPLTSSIVIDVSKHLVGIKHIGTETFTALPGTPFPDIESTLAKRNLMYPPYPASKDYATIGGMVANNSGGEKTLKYGKTDQFVRSIKLILSDSSEVEFRRLNSAEVTQKMAQTDFEGTIYQVLAPLLKDNWDLIGKAKPRVTKNSSGYALWNAYDPADGSVDLAQLIIGSQGTLGIITAVTLKAVPIEPNTELLVLYLHNLDELEHAVDLLRPLQPTSLEFFDKATIGAAIRFAPKLIALLGKDESLIEIGENLLPDLGILLKHGPPAYVLLAEFTGSNQTFVANQAQDAQQQLEQTGFGVRHPATQAERDIYWTIRRQSYNLLRSSLHNVQSAAFIDDVVVPPERLTEFLRAIKVLLAEFPQFTFSIVGHAGDGNLHMFPLMDMRDEKLRALIPIIAERVYDLTLDFGGSLSAEHNDGLIRGPYLETQFGTAILDLMKTVKHTFDPQGIFNPHKKTNASTEYSTKHIKNDNEHSA